ncbi:MAG: transporter substrate-binding domain-containing protein [Verrucomicrobiota bacterium]
MFFLVFVLGMAGCETGQGGRKEEGELPPPPRGLRVGLAPVTVPLAFERKGELTGLEVDFAEALGAALQRPVELVPLKQEALFSALESGEVDILMSGLEVTGQNLERAAFAEPYFSSGPMLLVRSKDYYSYSYPKILLLTPARIGVLPGSEADRYVEERCLRATRVPVASAEVGAKLLRQREIDVFLADALVIWQLARPSGIGASDEPSGLAAVEYPLEPRYYAWAVAKGNDALLIEVNALLETWEESGELRRLLRKWVPLHKVR